MVGILHAKDLFHLYARERLVVLEDAMRRIVEIPPDLPVTDALRQFRRGRNHLAIVREPGGPLLGVCTLEDVLEEIVGEIDDEHDDAPDEHSLIAAQADGQFVVDALTPIADFNDRFGANFADDEYDTIGGGHPHRARTARRALELL